MLLQNCSRWFMFPATKGFDAVISLLRPFLLFETSNIWIQILNTNHCNWANFSPGNLFLDTFRMSLGTDPMRPIDRPLKSILAPSRHHPLGTTADYPLLRGQRVQHTHQRVCPSAVRHHRRGGEFVFKKKDKHGDDYTSSTLELQCARIKMQWL